MDATEVIENSGNHGILEKPLKSSNENDEHLKHNFVSKYCLLCLVTFCEIFALVFSMYTVNQYAYHAIQKRDYPNVTFNSSSHSVCNKNSTSLQETIESEIQSKASQWSVYTSLASGIPALFSTSIFSSMSDIYGRKITIFISLLGTFLKTGLTAMAIYLDLSIDWIILFYGIEGLSGGWIVLLSVSFAYIADMTSAGKRRSFFMSLYELVVYFGFTMGAFVSGFFIKAEGFLYPEITAAGAALLGIMITPALPETFHESGAKNEKKLLQVVKNMSTFFCSNEGNKRHIYILYMISLLFIMLSKLGNSSVEMFFIMGSPFCMTSVDISLYTTVRGVSQQVFGIFMIKILQYCIRDESITLLSIFSSVAYLVILGFANSMLMLLIAPAVGAFSLPAIPMMRALLSKLTPVDKQGAIFAVIAFAENVCSLVSSVINGAIYSNTVSFMRGFVFLVCAGYYVIPLVLLGIVLVITREGKPYQRFDNEISVNT